MKLTGTAVSKGPSPCWLGDTTTIFRAAVPTSLFAAGAGNGLFQLTLQSGASGLTDNSDPFAIISGKINLTAAGNGRRVAGGGGRLARHWSRCMTTASPDRCCRRRAA